MVERDRVVVYHDGPNAWRWKRIDRAGTFVAEPSVGFKDLESCTLDARSANRAPYTFIVDLHSSINLVNVSPDQASS